MADFYGVLTETKNRGSKKQMDEDFQEEDVWDVLSESEDDSRYKEPKVKGKSTSSRVMISSTESQEVKMADPAPVDITGWAKIHKKGHRDVSSYNDASHHYYHDDDGDGDDDGEIVPPHEYLRKRLARTQIASFSMCEGVGRTLKGRDLSKLRNAILTKTGFLEG